MDIKKKLEVMAQIEAANKRHLEQWKQEEAQKMLAVFVDVYGSGLVKAVRVKDDLDEFYSFLDCTTIDMPTRWIGGKEFVVICDDEALFRNGYKPSAYNGNERMLVGNLLVVADAGGGEVRGLTWDEVVHIMSHIRGLSRTEPDGSTSTWVGLVDVTYTQDEGNH